MTEAKLSPEVAHGNKVFKQEVKRLGVDGFCRQQMDILDKQKKDAFAKADEIMEENVDPVYQAMIPKFSFSFVTQDRWDSIFKKENSYARS